MTHFPSATYKLTSFLMNFLFLLFTLFNFSIFHIVSLLGYPGPPGTRVGPGQNPGPTDSRATLILILSVPKKLSADVWFQSYSISFFLSVVLYSLIFGYYFFVGTCSMSVSRK